ncbi:MAG TPA: hypothetical protein VHM20_06340, partial [Gammaproteobacteria bacterium]|nr:hypothetical protein [Gammaproteobacteria bacterium]
MGITLQDAESYFNENVKNYTAFTLDELKRDSTAFKNMLGRYESRIQLLDEQKKNQYTELLRNSFWKCANISPVREDQLKELINSPYFKIESACSNGKPILIAAIDFCREKMNDLPLRIILQNQKILNTLHLKDAEGNLATDHAVKNSFSMQALQLLLEKRARCQFSYDMLVHIQMVSEGACLHDVINLHENVNLIDESSKKSLAELAHKNNNEEILFALLKCNAKFDISQIDGGLAGLEERANLQAKRKRAEKYYYHHLQPQQKVPQLDASFDLPKLRETIEMFDKDFKYVDEQKQLFYSTQLLSLFQEYANKPGNIEHLKMIIQSPFFKVSDINMKIIVDHAAKVWGVTQEPLQALLCHEDIRSYILKRCETLNPDAGYAVFYNLMMQHGAKFVCSYEQLIQAKACFKLDDFHSILCSLKNINELIPIIIDNKNDELLIDIHMAGVKLKDASVMPNIHVVRPRFEARQKAELFYKNSMLTKDQTEFNNFTTDEFKETEENFKALVDKYNKHMANLDAKHQDHYTRLLENAFKENLKNPTLSLNHLKSITSSPFFKCLESKECKIIIEDSIALCNKKNDVPIQALLHVPSIKKFIIGQYT